MQTQLLKHIHLDIQDVLVQLLALLGRADHEHLHLAELMHAVQPLARRAGRAGLCPEAPPVRGHLDWQALLRQNLVEEHAAEGDLGRARQAQVRVLHAVDLRPLAAWLKAALL